jgi:hypothetical protein
MGQEQRKLKRWHVEGLCDPERKPASLWPEERSKGGERFNTSGTILLSFLWRSGVRLGYERTIKIDIRHPKNFGAGCPVSYV